jgi:hypothetical protein
MAQSTAPVPEKHNSPKLPPTAPYEAPLTKAFDKLTSEIFIFLLAYGILIIGLAVFGEKLASTLKTLLYIIPILGVVAYLWQSQKTIRNKVGEAGINIRAGIVSDSADVAGVRGAKAGNPLPEHVDVGVGAASGKARVSGLIYGKDEGSDNSEKYLLDLFKDLNKVNRGELISSAQKLLRKQGQ